MRTDDPERRVNRMLREHAGLAYEEELRRALLPLADDFDRWRRGELASTELSERIHLFHDGAARKIWSTYHDGDPRLAVAGAIHLGILPRDQVPAELLEALAFFESQDESPGAPARFTSTRRP